MENDQPPLTNSIAESADQESAVSAKSFDEMSLDELGAILSLTIKHDHSNKIVVLLAMLSAYTERSQINISLNAPSSTGKSFLANEVAKLFPKEDKVERSGASPTSFFYGQGEVDEETGTKVISLERKILLFYEQPDPSLQAKLRALLSHDEKDLRYAFTNKNKGKNQTDDIILRGFPSSVFCSAGMTLDPQEATRAILLSPEATDEKILAAMQSQAARSANADKYYAWLDSQVERQRLMERIVAIRDMHIDEVIVPNVEKIYDQFRAMFPVAKSRHARDIDHLIKLIQAIALLNIWYRIGSDGKYYANEFDVQEGLKLWAAISESQEYNLPPAVLQFYKTVLLPAYVDKYKRLDNDTKSAMRRDEIGLTAQELSSYHIAATEKPMNGEQVRKQILPQLENVGLIIQQKPIEGADRRTRHIFPKVFYGDIEDPRIVKNIGMGGVDDIATLMNGY